MESTEDKILERAVEIAIAQPELREDDMISIVMETTGKSHETAKQAVIEAAAKLGKTVNNAQEVTSEPLPFWVIIAAGILTMFVAFKLITPILLGDRSVMDILTPQEEIDEAK